MEMLAEVQKVLVRCDELRFSGDGQKKVFAENERSGLASQLKAAVLHFEKYHEAEDKADVNAEVIADIAEGEN